MLFLLRQMSHLLSFHLQIYDQLLQTGIYDTKGQRKKQDKPLDEEDDLTDEACKGLVFTFKASPGWYKNFMKRNCSKGLGLGLGGDFSLGLL